jgi:hypothetical protein
MEEIRNRFTQYELFDFLEFVVGVFSLISSAIAIYTFWVTPTDKIQIFVFVIIAILSLCVIFFIKTWKLKNIAQERLSAFSKAFHRYTDELRDKLYNLTYHYETGSLSYDQLRTESENMGQIVVDLLADILTLSTGKKVSVCIKYFPDDQPRPSDERLQEEDYLLKTLCRSHNSDPNRKIDELTPIRGNTSFFRIMNERKGYFAASNLLAWSRKMREAGMGGYQNPNPDWEKYYLSTIVVPIRIKEKSETRRTDIKYDLIGFLCADSLSTSAFRETQIDDYVHLIKSFASGLYIYLDQIFVYRYNLTNEEGNDLESV